MKKFSSLNGCRLSPVELADLCELFVSGELNEFQLAKKFSISLTTVDRYLYKHYYGLVDKKKQTTITLKSKEIQEFI
ncbi:hypothetical protein [Pedobacter sp. B4-66]|uniref:hypothetical protein n=1 Tax=Pedobacter sp. B4-66 TaxID=2817280 RepID=UPI001BDAD98B|nr:hypothetical protein [Pedobacter sp. B4-66]